MNINPNAAAFPSAPSANGEGLTIIAYFAAHAPEVPEWFQIPALPAPCNPLWSLTTDADRELVKSWIEDEYDEIILPERLEWYWEAHDKYTVEMDTYYARNQQARYFAWRTFYATQMIQELNKAEV